MAAAATDDPADGALALRVYTSRLIGAEPEAAAQEIFSDRVALVPYVGPGFALVEAAADVFDAHPADEGPPIVNHGQLTFGETARGSLPAAPRTAEVRLPGHAGRRRERRPHPAPAR